MGRGPFMQKPLLGGEPPEGYLEGGMWVEDVARDDNIVGDLPMDKGWNHKGIHLEDVNAKVGEEQSPPQCWMSFIK